MNFYRLTALALAGTLTLSLTACGGGSEPTPTPAGSVAATQPAVTESAAPTPSEVPSESVRPSDGHGLLPASEYPSETPAATPIPTKAPEETATPTPKPTPVPTVTPGPTPNPEPTPAPAAVTASSVYDAVKGATGVSFSDMSFALEDFYSLSAGDLEDYVLYMPDMSTDIQEVLVAKAKSGKLESVKSACTARQQGMKEDAEFYGSTGEYVDGYKLATNGDWVLFYVGPSASAAVKAFNDCTK